MITNGLSKRKRLLLVGVLGVMATLNVYIAIPAITGKAAHGYCDFQIFKIAGRMLADGQRSNLFNLAAQAAVHRELFPGRAPGHIILPYNHLAYEALLFLPLARVGYATSYYLWIGFDLLLMIAIAVLGTRIINARLAFAPLLFLAEVAFFPIVFTQMEGQVSVLLLFLYVVSVLALKREHDYLAGAVLALGLFKFHLVLPFVFALMLRRKWKFVVGFIASAVPLLIVSVAITGVAGAYDYVRLIAFFQKNPPEVFVKFGAMPNLRGLIMGYLGEIAPGFARILVLFATLVLIVLLLRLKFALDCEVAEDCYLALAITFTMLVSFHLYQHDLSPMFLALLLTGRHASAGTVRAGPVIAFSFICCCTPLYAVAVWYNCLSLLALIMIVFALYLAWFTVPKNSQIELAMHA